MELFVFISIQFINVVLSTIKSILTVNGGRMTASIINAISYTFGAVITKMITSQSFEIVIFVTLFSNLIGVYLAKVILDKTKKEKLWTITATIKEENEKAIQEELIRRDIQFTLVKAQNNRLFLTMFSHSKGESLLIKEIIENANCKYYITENVATL